MKECMSCHEKVEELRHTCPKCGGTFFLSRGQDALSSLDAMKKQAAAKEHNDRGAQLMRKGYYEEAEKEFRQGIEANPFNGTAYSNLGFALQRQGKLEDAIPLMEKALSLHPGLEGVPEALAQYKAEAQKKRLESQPPKMEYFEVPEANPGKDGICSDNACPCGYPGATIPRGTGYMYISKAVVDFRKDARTVQEATRKIALMKSQMTGSTILFDQNVVTSTLMCEQGARKRGLDLEVAAADARYWWKTGLVPLRETPLAGRPAPKTVTPRPAQPVSSQPAIVRSAPVAKEKSPVVAAVLSFFLLGGAGQIYLGYWKKGLAFILATWVLSFLFIGVFIGFIGVGDAYGTAQKMKEGKSVGEWQFNINWKVAGIAALIVAIVVVVFLAIMGMTLSK